MASREDTLFQRRGLQNPSSNSDGDKSSVNDESSALKALNSGKEKDLQALRIAIARGHAPIDMFQKRGDCIFKLVSYLSNIQRSDLVFQSILLIGCVAERAKDLKPLRQKLSKHAGAYFQTYMNSYPISEPNFQMGLFTAVANLAFHCPAAVGNLRSQHIHLTLVRLLTDRMVIEDDGIEAHVCCLRALNNMCDVSVKVIQDVLDEKCWTPVCSYSRKLLASDLQDEDLEEAGEELIRFLTYLLTRNTSSDGQDLETVVSVVLTWFSGKSKSLESLLFYLSEMLQVYWERYPNSNCSKDHLLSLTKAAVTLVLTGSSSNAKAYILCLLGNLCCRWSTAMSDSVINQISGLPSLISQIPQLNCAGQLEGCRFVCAMLRCGQVEASVLDACISMVWAILSSAASEASKINDERAAAAASVLLVFEKFHQNALRSLMTNKSYMRTVLKSSFERLHGGDFDLSSLSWIVCE